MNETPRKSRSERLISEPAQRGFFLWRDTVPAMLLRMMLVLLVVGLFGMLAGCAGPSDTEAAQMIAEDAQEATEAEQVRWMLVQLSGEHPADISPEDWKAAQDVIKGAQ